MTYLGNSTARSECIPGSEQKKLESMQEEVGKVDLLFRKFCSLGREEGGSEAERDEEKSRAAATNLVEL